MSEFFSDIRSVGRLLLLLFGLFHFVSVFALHTERAIVCACVCVFANTERARRRSNMKWKEVCAQIITIIIK